MIYGYGKLTDWSNILECQHNRNASQRNTIPGSLAMKFQSKKSVWEKKNRDKLQKLLPSYNNKPCMSLKDSGASKKWYLKKSLRKVQKSFW